MTKKKESWPKRDPFFGNSQGIPWLIPYKCEVCNKCWLHTDQHGKPSVTQDNLGRSRLHCVYGGPYLDYIEIKDD